jgi:hypothetical protein
VLLGRMQSVHLAEDLFCLAESIVVHALAHHLHHGVLVRPDARRKPQRNGQDALESVCGTVIECSPAEGVDHSWPEGSVDLRVRPRPSRDRITGERQRKGRDRPAPITPF